MLGFMLLFSIALPHFPFSNAFPLFGMYGGVAMVALSLGIFRSMRSANGTARGPFVMVDATGLAWQQGRATEQIAWRDIQLIGRSTGTTISANITYLLVTPQRTFVWRAQGTTLAAFNAAERLVRIALTQTKLPLRDVTNLLKEVALANSLRVGFAPRVRLDGTALSALAPAPARWQFHPARFAFGLVALAAILAAFVIGGVLQYQQSRLTTDVPGLLHGQQPIFSDSLARPSGYWFLHTPTKAEPWRVAYGHGALELSGTAKGDYVAEPGPGSSGDLVVEVTATQSGLVTNTSGDGVGLIFRAAPDLSDFLAFTIQHNGDWQLQHYHYVDDNPNDN
jgi:hypothetical protein